MRRVRCREVLLGGLVAIAAGAAAAQTADTSETRRVDEVRRFPVTDEMLRNPDPSDWLMYSRTYDAQRFSPLDQIDTGNVSRLEKAWSKALPPGVIEVIP